MVIVIHRLPNIMKNRTSAYIFRVPIDSCKEKIFVL